MSNLQALALALKEFPSYQVNNAGCMVNQREVTEDGLEKNFATNTLGKIVFTSSFSEIDDVLRWKKALYHNLNVREIYFKRFISLIITTPKRP